MYYCIFHVSRFIRGEFACKETTQPYLLPARQALCCRRNLPSRGWLRPPAATCHHHGTVPSTGQDFLPITSPARRAAAAPQTPACTGARSTSPGRRGRTRGTCWGRTSGSAWRKPCRVSGCCSRWGAVCSPQQSPAPRGGTANNA